LALVFTRFCVLVNHIHETTHRCHWRHRLLRGVHAQSRTHCISIDTTLRFRCGSPSADLCVLYVNLRDAQYRLRGKRCEQRLLMQENLHLHQTLGSLKVCTTYTASLHDNLPLYAKYAGSICTTACLHLCLQSTLSFVTPTPHTAVYRHILSD
jgi:hypothetical protein